MKTIILIVLLSSVSLTAFPIQTRTIKGIAELVVGFSVIGFSMYNMSGCKQDLDPITEHPVKTVLFDRSNIKSSLKTCGVRIGFSVAAMLTVGLPLCYLGLFELLHKPKPKSV